MFLLLVMNVSTLLQHETEHRLFSLNVRDRELAGHDGK